ncbi:MAG: hypothetical protein D6813_09835 [Calditrichaeota bacterium]|nr:MAG: hypothetical protein D6813_09835 [Calditrichota bacterium]
MLPNLKRYHRPKSITEALALLHKNSGSIFIIAGGTKLVPSKNPQVEELVDITGLELNYIQQEYGVLRIGATTTLQQMVESPILKTFAHGLLSEAAQLTHVSRMIRNVSTLGGELTTTTPLSILYCAFLVLQAQVRLVGCDEFALAMNIFLSKRKLDGGMLIEVLIPQLEPRTYAAMVYTRSLHSWQPAICACARITVDKGLCTSAKIAITGTEPVPQRLYEVEEFLENNSFTQKNIEHAAQNAYEIYNPISDALATAEYRKEVSRFVIHKVLSQCLEFADELL